MSIGRDGSAAKNYAIGNKDARHEMVMFSQCDRGRTNGLLRAYIAMDFDTLDRIRSKPAKSRAAKLRRKAEFIMVLSRMAERAERMSKES